MLLAIIHDVVVPMVQIVAGSFAVYFGIDRLLERRHDRRKKHDEAKSDPENEED